MKYILLLAMIAILGCGSRSDEVKALRRRVDSLQHRLDSVYTPGIGEFMSSVQVHHEKLWFAGLNGNWPLADFELHEMGEAFDGVRQVGHDSLVVQILPMIDSLLGCVKSSVDSRNEAAFTQSYTMLTVGCNNCHLATNHGYNKIVIPVTPPLTDQDFRP